MVNGFRDRPAGTLRLNVPVSAARLVLPRIVPPFLAAYPDIRLEVIAEDSFVDVLAAGCDAGIRYEERLEQDMIAVPIGPRVQRFAAAASPAYLDRRGRPEHPRDLLGHACLRGPFSERRDAGLGVRARRRGGAGRSNRAADRAARRRQPILPSTPRSPAPASSICSRTGCARTSTAARSNRSSNPGGSASRGLFSIIPGGASCPRRCGRSSISSRHRLANRHVMAREQPLPCVSERRRDSDRVT